MSKMILSLMMVAVASSSPLKVEQTKAASPYVNIGCQCSPLTFQDQYGAIQVRRLSVQHCLYNTPLRPVLLRGGRRPHQAGGGQELRGGGGQGGLAGGGGGEVLHEGGLQQGDPRQ